MRFFKIFLSGCLLLLSAAAQAQFYTTGDTSPAVKWNSLESDHYRFIYPRGADSLARVYAREFEFYRDAIGQSTGVKPSETYKKKFPVVLHTGRAYSNGVVVWAPQRLEVYTTPDAYSPDPLPWATEIALHEGRHISQMQFGHMNKLKSLNYVLGEMWNGLLSGVYFSQDWLEGDAVLAETALSRSGRGRRADFLNYYMISFDKGDYRSWWRWMGGSQLAYTPNPYALGYLFYGGMRHYFDAPLVSKEYIDMVSQQPLSFFYFQNRVAENHTGLGPVFTDSFFPIAENTYRDWLANAQLRGPFTQVRPLIETPSSYTVYEGMTMLPDGTAYAFRGGMDRVRELVSISPDGKVKVIGSAAAQTSDLRFSPADGRIYWSETHPHARWSRQSESAIWYMTEGGSMKKLSKGRYFNPAPSGEYISASRYLETGGSSVVLLDRRDGNVVAEYPLPSGMQAVQTATTTEGGSAGTIFLTALSSQGNGLYHLGEQGWVCDIQPQPVVIEGLFAEGGEVYFTSDRNGSNELYCFSAASGKVRQMTSTRYGGSSFAIAPGKGKSGILGAFAQQEGQIPGSIAAGDLLGREVDFADIYHYPVAEGISAQEAALDGGSSLQEPWTGEPEKYNKLLNSVNVHSWAPAYVNPGKLVDFDFDPFYKTLSLGATAISQNLLGSTIFSAGYSLHRDPMVSGRWRNSAHLNWTYTGWYPTLSLSLDYGDRDARLYRNTLVSYDKGETYYIGSSTEAIEGKPFMDIALESSIPWRFSSHGWSSGITPKIALHFTNDRSDPHVESLIMDNTTGQSYPGNRDVEYMAPFGLNKTYMTASLSAFRVRGTAPAGVYPRLGGGIETGVLIPGNFMIYNPVAYASAFAYLPGLTRNQGLKVVAMAQQTGFNFLNYSSSSMIRTLPRGFENDASLFTVLTQNGKNSGKLALDYAVPFSFGDIDLGKGMLYVKRFVFTPHFDLGLFSSDRMSGNLWSAGAELRADVGAAARLPMPFELGVSASLNGGSLFKTIEQAYEHGKVPMSRFYITPTFNISF